jgi:hypothetical protein
LGGREDLVMLAQAENDPRAAKTCGKS